GGVVLLGQESHLVGVAHQGVHQLGGIVEPVGVGVLFHQPERAHQERVLVAGQAVGAGAGAVAQRQPGIQEVGFDLLDGGEHVWVVVVDETGLRDLQQGGVGLGVVIGLGEG